MPEMSSSGPLMYFDLYARSAALKSPDARITALRAVSASPPASLTPVTLPASVRSASTFAVVRISTPRLRQAFPS